MKNNLSLADKSCGSKKAPRNRQHGGGIMMLARY